MKRGCLFYRLKIQTVLRQRKMSALKYPKRLLGGYLDQTQCREWETLAISFAISFHLFSIEHEYSNTCRNGYVRVIVHRNWFYHIVRNNIIRSDVQSGKVKNKFWCANLSYGKNTGINRYFKKRHFALITSHHLQFITLDCLPLVIPLRHYIRPKRLVVQPGPFHDRRERLRWNKCVFHRFI